MALITKRGVVELTLCSTTFFILCAFLLVQELSQNEESETAKGSRHRHFDEEKRNGSQATELSNVIDGEGWIYGAVFRKGVVGNYEPPPEPRREGPGEGAIPLKTEPKERETVDRLRDKFGFNQLISDKIALDRTIPDFRQEECRYWHYPEKLPSTSVVLAVHNEGWSTLLRTVHSVFNRTPPRLLHELIIVDDLSTRGGARTGYKGKSLESYSELPKFEGKLKVVRNSKREGLIRTRIIGARHATGEVVVWLDAHCEAGFNWLPPLIAPIAANRTTVTCPIIMMIDDDDFSMGAQSYGDEMRGGFDWGLTWKHLPLPNSMKRQKKHQTEPHQSPAMAGGLFAMNRKYFFELGAYDEQLEIWGAENYELSFKVWMCGGTLLNVPCSKVSHVYRVGGKGKIPFDPQPNITWAEHSDRNFCRVVEAWLDDYKKYFYWTRPNLSPAMAGNVDKQIEFRARNKCKTFDWFMKEIASDIAIWFPLPTANILWGEIREREGQYCVDSLGGNYNRGSIGMYPCHGMGMNQLFLYKEHGQICQADRCLQPKRNGIKMVGVKPAGIDGEWSYDQPTGMIHHAGVGLCMQRKDADVIMATCDASLKSQQWVITDKNMK